MLWCLGTVGEKNPGSGIECLEGDSVSKDIGSWMGLMFDYKHNLDSEPLVTSY